LVRAVRQREFVTAAVATGVTQGRILFRHILPNITGPLLTQAMLMLPTFLLPRSRFLTSVSAWQDPEASLGNILWRREI
jgi:ABC-type dipeptide/oligopeptide/nickel transport system permease subunit